MNTRPEVLLFDLGGVIVPWVGTEALMEICALSREEVLARFAGSDVLRKFEIGACSSAEFSAEILHVFSLDMAAKDIPALWNSWVHPPFPETEDILRQLKRDYSVACLSNTNELHWQHLDKIMDFSLFEPALASQNLGLAKPDAACFLQALELLDTPPETVLFFDDTSANVEAAKAIGMSAVLVDRTVGVVPKLRELGLI